VKPPAFAYHRPGTIDEALELLADLGDDARVLAGGQSLIPVLNFRLTHPSALVDLNGVAEMDFIEEGPDGGLRMGAMTRQRTAELNPVVTAQAPLLAEALPWVAHPAIRNRGTMGGSLAHADPASELPAVMVALGARFGIYGRDGGRLVEADAFFPGLFSTALEQGEILGEVHLPALEPGSGVAFEEVARRHGDFALAGVAALIELDPDGECRDARLGLLGLGTGPVLARSASAELVGEAPTEARIAAAARVAAAEDASPLGDVHASADYRRSLAEILVRRALVRAVGRARGAVEAGR